MTHLWQFHGGVKLDEQKSLSNQTPIIQANIPPFLILPLLQHIGDPPKPIVQVGDRVLKGQILAHCQEESCSLRMSVPVHSSSSGTVIAIEPRAIPHPSGLTALCIIIKTDGKDEWIAHTPLKNYSALAPEVVRNHIAKAGIVGLGGAGFPAHIKLKHQINTLIINGAECEPYITCDDRLMREHPAHIIAGTQIIMHILGGAKRCIIAVEDNKPAAYHALLEAAQGQPVEVLQVPTQYPTGGERLLIHVLTGKKIRRTQLPVTQGIMVHNVETARAVYRAVQLGWPLLSRVITVTGRGVEKPQNLEVRLGTPMHTLIKQCGCQQNTNQLIMGGPMMGFALPHDNMPVIKTTNCLIVSTTDNSSPASQMPCIRCGACAQVCPIHLLPQQLYWYAKAKNFKKLLDYHLFECIECDCCAYVCPSRIPLLDYYRYAKAQMRTCEQERKKAEIARQRYEFRTKRLECERKEQIASLKKQKIVSNATKKAAIEAAVKKAKSKINIETFLPPVKNEM